MSIYIYIYEYIESNNNSITDEHNKPSVMVVVKKRERKRKVSRQKPNKNTINFKTFDMATVMKLSAWQKKSWTILMDPLFSIPFHTIQHNQLLYAVCVYVSVCMLGGWIGSEGPLWPRCHNLFSDIMHLTTFCGQCYTHTLVYIYYPTILFNINHIYNIYEHIREHTHTHAHTRIWGRRDRYMWVYILTKWSPLVWLT